jgi:hypothetical protein
VAEPYPGRVRRHAARQQTHQTHTAPLDTVLARIDGELIRLAAALRAARNQGHSATAARLADTIDRHLEYRSAVTTGPGAPGRP